MPDPPNTPNEPPKAVPDPQIAALTSKVNSLLDELAKEKAARARVEKVNALQKQWPDFKDDGKVDLESVEFTLKNYKPAAKPNSQSAPAPPTGGKRTLNTPNGKKNSEDVDQSTLAVRPADLTDPPEDA